MWKYIIDIVFFGALYTTFSFLMPKVKEDNKPPPKLEVPDTQIGTPIPVLFGTKPIKSPILVDYGNIRIIKVPIDQEGKK